MAVVARATLQSQAVTIRDETTTNANTATRVGGQMKDEADSFAMDADLTAHEADVSNPHSVTKTQVGLGNVDNTADASKSFTAAQTTSGTFADARISQSSVTQHQAALSLTASQVSDFDTEVSNNASVTANTAKVSWTKPAEIQLSCSDLTSDLTVSSSVAYVRMPYAMTLTEVRASVLTAATGANLIVDINEGGVSVLSTKLSIDVSEKTSTTATTPPVISDSSLADDAEITIDIDQIGSTIAGAGLIVTLIGTRT